MRVELWRNQLATGLPWAQQADERARAHGHYLQASELAHPVTALDLSSDPLVFCLDQRHRFSHRRMVAGDLPYVLAWRARAEVAQWWGQMETEELEKQYRARLAPDDPVAVWIWEVNGRSIGFGQDYWLPAAQTPPGVPSGQGVIVGLDFAIGEPAFRNRGLATSLLWSYLRDIIAATRPTARYVLAAPDHRNSGSQRVLRKLGFEPHLWVDEADADGTVITKVIHLLDVTQVFGAPITSR